ncbi:Uridine nucleosidase 1 [Grifola frondosa]|uniref:Uridine nucleosidase 1 n=1 Tax=Grifola frondosa TaxID=5627 RepID=A0A1C7LR92_GRIFR|nr:Uridine nucleosidase 1 [Grifola frondosa]
MLIAPVFEGPGVCICVKNSSAKLMNYETKMVTFLQLRVGRPCVREFRTCIAALVDHQRDLSRRTFDVTQYRTLNFIEMTRLARRTPVIIDTDPGVDDTLAILLALSSPELEVLAIIISFGNTDAQSSYSNVLKIYQAISRHIEHYPETASRFPNFLSDRRTILALGEDGPLEGDLHSAQYFHGRDGLGELTQRHPDLNVPDENPTDHPQLQLTEKSGVDVSLDLIRSEPERSITYVALGPLTNLAEMMRRDRNVVRTRIGRIVCMGGALDVPGNTSPMAEFNFFADPYAVRELLTPTKPELGIPLERFLLLPLDVTTPHELSFPLYKARVDPPFQGTISPSQAHEKSPLVHFTSSFLERTREVMVEFGKDAMELHDPVAVWCAIANPPVMDEAEGVLPTLQLGWTAVKRTFEIERTGELTRGMLVIDRRDDQGAYAPGANRAEVQAELEKHHFHHVGSYESTALPAQVEIERRPSQELASIQHLDGVACITETPGPEVLVNLLLERIWGVVI